MPRPPLVQYTGVADYRTHFERVYCQGPIVTFDGIPVRFRKTDFDHCMQKTARGHSGQKIGWANDRLERIDWIKATLEHSGADLYFGWHRGKKAIAYDRRVAVVYGSFMVAIALTKAGGAYRGRFITAYPADARTIAQIRAKPRWHK